MQAASSSAASEPAAFQSVASVPSSSRSAANQQAAVLQDTCQLADVHSGAIKPDASQRLAIDLQEISQSAALHSTASERAASQPAADQRQVAVSKEICQPDVRQPTAVSDHLAASADHDLKTDDLLSLLHLENVRFNLKGNVQQYFGFCIFFF